MAGLRYRYYRLRDKLLPLGTRRRLLLIILLEATVKNDRPLSLRNVKEFARNIGLFIGNRTVLDERLRGRLIDRVAPLVPLSTGVTLPPDEGAGVRATIAFRLEDEPTVSIVIPVYDKWAFTAQCLDSLARLSGEVPFEVTVVDNGSRDETETQLKMVENLHRIRNSENVGFVEACNQGIRVARGKYVLFLNNDTVVTNGSLRRMVDLAEKDGTIGLVGAKLVYPDGRLQEAGGIVWNDEVNIAWNYGRFDSPGKPEYNYVKDSDYCSGACLLARREALLRVGLFDKRYAPAYFEDTDLAFSMRAHGYRVVYQPASTVYHLEGITAGTDTSSGLKAYQEVNRRKFWEKWGPEIVRHHFPCGDHLFLARDRARFRKIMFYMDHQVPAYDRDAGSLITYRYLKIFSELGLKIVFWPDNMQNPEPYTSELQQLGIEVVFGYGNFRRYMQRFGRYFDYVTLSRPLFSVKYIDSARELTRAAIFYVAHDLHYLREQRRAETEGNPRLVRFAKRLKKKEIGVMKKSDVALVFSDYEKEVVAAEDPNIRIQVMPWIQPPQAVEAKPEGRRNLLFLGSFVHRPNIDGLIWFVEEIWPRVAARLTGQKLIVVGNAPTREVLALGSPDIMVMGYVPDTQPLFQEGRVFVAPLRYGAGVKGKILEAMSYGLAVVTTKVGAEGLRLTRNKDVFIEDSAEGFADKTCRLFEEDALWRRLSSGGMRFVQEKASEENAATFCRTLIEGTYR